MDLNIPQKLFKKNLNRTIFVFLSSFFIIFSILNAQAVYDRIGYYFIPEADEQKSNLELENLYKSKYGHSINGLSVSSNLSLSVLEDSLAAIGKATTELNQSSPTILSNQTQTASVNTNTNSNFISISRLNVKAPIVEPVSVAENKILASLKSGVVLYPGSAVPGQLGTTVIIGHSSSTFPFTKYSGIFAGLNKLAVGDMVYINYEGRGYTYIIKDKKIGSSVELASSNVSGDLILASCWPIGTDKNRIIITADLE